jgi:hyperosmotically inducible periplasmic protein
MSFASRGIRGFVFVSAMVVLATALLASPLPTQESGQQPDNTKTNKTDRDKSSPTADQQRMNASDRELTRRIRASIMSDKRLSTYAHNVKVVAQDGKVTLKGPVRSEDEKNAIEAKATEVAGTGNVIDQLEVAPPKS